jgi:hypothetical protein
VERERQNIADPSNAAGLAGVVNSAPSGSTYGLVTWNQPSGTQSISGTVTATQSTGSNLHVVVDTAPSTAVTGTVTANQGTAGTLANAWPAELTDGTHGPAAVKAASTAAAAADPALVVAISPNNSVAVTGTFFQGTQPVSGTVTSDIVGHAGATLDGTAGSPSTGVLTVQGVSGGTAIPVSGAVTATVASTTVTNTVAVSGTVTANQGTANTAANAWPVEVTDGTNVNSVKAASTAAASTDKSIVVQLNPVQPNLTTALNVTAVSGSTTAVTQATAANLNATVVGTGTFAVQATNATAANFLAKADIVGNSGATLDAVVTAATAPANGVATLAVNETTAPSLSTGQSVAVQCDWGGNLFVKPIRRQNTTSKATTIAASTTATTILAAQASGVFADISNLLITVTPTAGATAGVTFTATLSDGTNSYIFDMNTGNDSTTTIAGNPGDPINIHFNPPLPATSAATAWTQTNSVSTGVTTHTTVVAVLQKAS